MLYPNTLMAVIRLLVSISVSFLSFPMVSTFMKILFSITRMVKLVREGGLLSAPYNAVVYVNREKNSPQVSFSDEWLFI